MFFTQILAKNELICYNSRLCKKDTLQRYFVPRGNQHTLAQFKNRVFGLAEDSGHSQIVISQEANHDLTDKISEKEE